MVYIVDLQKTFDTVNHSVLINKLEHYGIRGDGLDCFSSYSSNRKQDVSVNGAASDYQDIICGVPQGSVFGPLLFNIHQ